jgi:hypothetical protein
MIWLTNECSDAVNLFWRLSGGMENFPRSLERSLALALPVALVKLPHLQLKSIEHWLRCRQVSYSFDCQSRYVRGCLVAYGGKGIIFVDGADPIEELRFSLAHEIAHFLMDYWLPRGKAFKNFGPSIVEVMDGHRNPTIEERIRSVIGGIRIGLHTDLLERGSDGPGLDAIWQIEDKADKVALALLADPEDVIQSVDLSASMFQQRKEAIVAALRSRFGLPDQVADVYGKELLIAFGKGPSWTETLGLR